MRSLAALDAKPINILLVEDDDSDAEAVRRAFESTRIIYRIWRAVDGVDALEMLRGTNGKKKAPSPFLLLIDLDLPRMNGIELLRALRADKALRHLISFVLSASRRPDHMKAAYDLNVAGYICKTAAGRDLLNLVNLVDGYRRAVEAPN